MPIIDGKFKSTPVKYPTVAEINDANNALMDQLALLRILNSSDLTFMYTVYPPHILKGIIEVAEGFFDQDPEQTKSFLTEAERLEYREHVNTIAQYILDDRSK
jgi:hypothetical protein